MSITESDVSTKEKLHHVQESTNDDGTLNVEITDWREHNGLIEIEYQLPTAEYETDTFSFPQRATDDYDLVRLCESCGYSIGSLDQLVGERVKYEDGSLVVPAHTSRVQQVKGHLTVPKNPVDEEGDLVFGILLWPLTSLMSVTIGEKNTSNFFRGMRVAAVGTWLWILLLVAVYFVFVF